MSELQEATPTNLIHNLHGRDMIITGTMGFIGSYVLAKLLHDVPESGKLFIIVRSRKGVNPRDRLTELVAKSKDLFKNVNLSRVIVVAGDCMMLESVSNEDLEAMKNVSVLIHIAASVDWTLPYEDALKANDVTKIYTWARDHFPLLKSFIQTSTSYSSPMINLHVTEQFDPDYLKMKDNHSAFANSYTWSKYIAEHELRSIVEIENLTNPSNACHVAIVRPGIVSGALGTDPFAVQGWNINVNTINAAFLAYGAWGNNIIWLVPARKDVRFNATPVDLVSNVLILTAAKLAGTTQQTSDVEIINCVQTEENVITWGKFMKIFSPNPRELIFVKSKKQFESLFKLLVEFPSIFVPHGKYKTAKLRDGLEIMLVFTIYNYQFETSGLMDLHNTSSQYEKRKFPVYFKDFTYDEYIMSCFNYAKTYIIKPRKEVTGNLKRRTLEAKMKKAEMERTQESSQVAAVSAM